MKKCEICKKKMVILLNSYVCENEHTFGDAEDEIGPLPDYDDRWDDLTPPTASQLAFYGWDDLGDT